MNAHIARLAEPGFAVAHCRLPAWGAGERLSLSAPSSIGLSFTGQTCDVRVAGRAGVRAVEAGSLVVVGPEPVEWLRVLAPSEVIEVAAGASLRAEVAKELGVADAADLGDLVAPAGPAAWAMGAQLRALTRDPGGADPLAAEALVRQLYRHVLRARFGGRLRKRGDGALDARRLARVAEHVDAHLASDLTLGALARVAALSPFHFQRSFHRATGCSPHRYVALRRADRARALLAKGRQPEEVAGLVGLGSVRRLRAAL